MNKNYHIDDTFLAKWLNNELTEEELTAFKKSEDYALYQKIADKSRQFKVPVFNQNKVYQKIQNQLEQQNSVKKLVPIWFYAVAASVLILLGTTFFFTNKTNYNSAIGQQISYVLPDGSNVQLNGESSISFSKRQWEKGNRNLELDGEGFFKVKKGSVFSVTTKEGVVTVLGTQFNVQTVKKYLAVECYEGKVNVKSDLAEFVLTPGKGVRFLDNNTKKYNTVNTEPNWLTKQYQYNAIPLSVVFKDIENVYKVKIINKGVNLENKYSGVLIKKDLEKALNVISKSMNFKYVVKRNEVIISN
ncbi:ferric-dicitrate binding protein FerR (iron transport regulator) [Wenyingzhuangia heitensis]|uniref:Ferric-dicitrate binding protein FerR (Iron transport regulator) n=1 Tax=Wenyingzhuangia heitensis TaxID=1487859 RepID=A0ABX0U9W1_9FLAO|nr:FecR family protein [Wenyingzhuangia heitensis]NIJ43862.1 ferric-dicitrate binding protein FerR (iron transport regulator) [Wenyingzhuangia heitensis]